MELVNMPVPVPFEVWGSAVVGLPVVFQQTPLVSSVAPPFAMTLPPPVAVVEIVPLIGVVVTTGTEGEADTHDGNLNEPMRVCQLPLAPFDVLL
jgi:hypothetical protein